MEHFLRQIIDINPQFIFVKDREGRFVLVNEAVAEAYGTTVDELVGKTDADFNDNPNEVEAFRRDDLEVMDSLREKSIAEEVITDASGHVRFLQTIKRPLVDADGVARHVLGVATDITRLKEAEAEKRRLETSVLQAQKLESLGVLAGGIAHDFNNLLVGVLANADVVKRRLEPGGGGDRALEMIRIAARRAAELCQQMLAYSGRGRFVMESVQLNDVVRELSQLLGASISKSAHLVYELDEELPLVRAEASQLRQIVMNLITNASDALEGRDGTVRLGTAVRRCVGDEVRDTCTGDPLPEGSYVVLEVSDTGMGMEPADVGRIFDPFYTTKISGRGLGLAAVQGIVHGHQGAVVVDSRHREGTTFRIYFPVAETPTADAGPLPVASAAVTGVRPCVLVVDDEPIVLAAIRDVLQLENVLAIVAENGQQGLEMLRRDPEAFSAALVDMTMPGMSGPELLREIRHIRPDLPVALMSGFDQRESVTGLEGAAPVAFLEKPFEATALLDLVRRLHAGDRPAGSPGQPASS